MGSATGRVVANIKCRIIISSRPIGLDRKASYILCFLLWNLEEGLFGERPGGTNVNRSSGRRIVSSLICL